MSKTDKIIHKAQKSGFHKWLLNLYLGRFIPFNRPHRIKVVEITDHSIRTFLPYRRSNFNHIRGIHACALATISEFTSGMVLSLQLKGRFRIIMESLEMKYHYQGKSDITAEFSIDEDFMEREVVQPLEHNDSVLIPCEVKTHDKEGNHISTGIINWQLKSWEKVRTKV